MSLKHIIQEINVEINAKDQVREKVLSVSREIVRLSAQAILSMHRQDFKDARKKLGETKKKVNKMKSILRGWPEIAHSGSVYVAYQEFAEASLLLNFIQEEQFSNPAALGIPSVPYILGLADMVGELRRRALDSIRTGDLETAEKCLMVMEDVQNLLMTLEHGYALAPGLRRKCDVARRLIEETRGDVTIETRRIQLEKSIKRLDKTLGGK